MQARQVFDSEVRGAALLKRCGYVVLVVECLLGVAHLLSPEYRWGQGRQSYFDLDNSLTLASWMASVQLFGIAILALMSFHRDRQQRHAAVGRTDWAWLVGALSVLILSCAEMTRFHRRLELFGYPKLDVYEQFIIFPLACGLLVLFGCFVLQKLRHVPGYTRYGIGWCIAWGVALFGIILSHTSLLPSSWDAAVTLVTGVAYLWGCTLLVLALGGYVLQAPAAPREPSRTAGADEPVAFTAGSSRVWILVGVGGMTFTIIFLQIILFRLLTIFGDYLTANSVISIALLGIAVGGLIGASTAQQTPVPAMITASLLLPVSILVAFGTSVRLMDSPFLASILLMLPFVCSSVVITIALVRIHSHLVYCTDLLGAALGAVLVSSVFSYFREESGLLFLGAFTALTAGCFIMVYPTRRVRSGLLVVALAGCVGFTAFGILNLHADGLNIVRTKIHKRYPKADVLFSRSSFVGRYDVVRRKPDHKSVAAYENGRITDNMRRRPTEQYQIDPRVPHTLMKDPDILILGLSGDAITKTAKALGRHVYGVEINPAVVQLQTNELVPFNANSYEHINVAVMDGRSYVEQSDRQFDMITLMNAHSARGRTAGRAPSPEYLDTREAIESYLDHLTDRGIVIVEEPVSRPRREPPVWKLLVTMRQVLLDRGSPDPAQHFFVFQWRTKRNNYMQILMKKRPFSAEEIARLKQWLHDVDHIKAIEARLGRRMGPIRSRTTLLHTPDETLTTNYARILRGEVDSAFLQARNLLVTTDDRPFHFDVDPAHPELKAAYGRTFLLTLLLAPFLLFFLTQHRADLRSALPYVFVVVLTGMGYFLIEVVLIQRYTIFLGSPVVTFTTVLGTLLLFSGLGSLWSGHIGRVGLYSTLGAILVLLMIHQWMIPPLFPRVASYSLAGKTALTVLVLAPLAFCMGVPFPFVLRTGKVRFTASAAALLFAINAAASALAVPLSLNLSLAYGFQATFHTAIFLYVVIGLSLLALQKSGLQLLTNSTAALAIGLLLICPWFISPSKAQTVTETPQYRVYGVSYGQSLRRENKILHGGSARNYRRFGWFFWVIQGQGRTILVDTGFDQPRLARRWKIRDFVQPIERLEQLGIAPSDVTDVILTHAHWDHMGSLTPYTRARVWIQEKEYLHATSRLSPSKPKSKGMRWKDVETLLQIEKEGRLQKIQGEATLVPGITMTLGGSHTPGFQYVTVNTLDGPVVIAGDASYLYDNNQRHIPIARAVDTQANLATIREMQRRAASPFFILPGHDPLVLRRFPQVSAGIVHITAVPREE